MAEYEAVFNYQLSATVFSFVTIGFMAAYAFTAIWLTARSTDRAVGALQPA